MNNHDLATILARELFALGSEPDDHCHRIEFKGGTYPDAEIPRGGMNEMALTSFFTRVLNRTLSKGGNDSD